MAKAQIAPSRAVSVTVTSAGLTALTRLVANAEAADCHVRAAAKTLSSRARPHSSRPLGTAAPSPRNAAAGTRRDMPVSEVRRSVTSGTTSSNGAFRCSSMSARRGSRRLLLLRDLRTRAGSSPGGCAKIVVGWLARWPRNWRSGGATSLRVPSGCCSRRRTIQSALGRWRWRRASAAVACVDRLASLPARSAIHLVGHFGRGVAPFIAASTGVTVLPRLGRRAEEWDSFTRLPGLPMKGA